MKRYHVFELKKKDSKEVERKQYTVLQLTDPIDLSNQELMNQKIHLVITLIDISFINFLPANWYLTHPALLLILHLNESQRFFFFQIPPSKKNPLISLSWLTLIFFLFGGHQGRRKIFPGNQELN